MPPRDQKHDIAEQITETVRSQELSSGASATTLFGRVVDQTGEVIAVALLGIIVLLIFLNAFFRYAFGNPLVWTEEIVASLIIWLAVTGAFLALRRRQLIAIEVVTGRLPCRFRSALAMVVQLASALVLAYLAWLGLRYTGLFGKDTTPFFGFPKGFFMAAIPVGMGAMAIAALVATFSRNKSSESQT
ncbi:MAG: TRAP transporter small permease [Arenicellales bacterium]|jgi:TRAP-type C4-dicarboxylate transport system permease small subunit|nr:TRAP transporter small permease [Arenicellales bacterium]|tara:strand:- start:1466 stop:2029 length:564 start_codon:yes stop_codon:yes gene_type:complete